jgi:hypothetical protein
MLHGLAVHFGLSVLIISDEDFKLTISLCILIQPPVSSSLFGPNILLNTLFSNTPLVSDQVSHPYKSIGLYIFTFLDSSESKRVQNLIVASLHFPPEIKIWFVTVIPQDLNFYWWSPNSYLYGVVLAVHCGEWSVNIHSVILNYCRSVRGLQTGNDKIKLTEPVRTSMRRVHRCQIKLLELHFHIP